MGYNLVILYRILNMRLICSFVKSFYWGSKENIISVICFVFYSYIRINVYYEVIDLKIKN